MTSIDHLGTYHLCRAMHIPWLPISNLARLQQHMWINQSFFVRAEIYQHHKRMYAPPLMDPSGIKHGVEHLESIASTLEICPLISQTWITVYIVTGLSGENVRSCLTPLNQNMTADWSGTRHGRRCRWNWEYVVSSDSIPLEGYWHCILRQYLPRGILTQYPQTVSPSGTTNTVSSDSISLGEYWHSILRQCLPRGLLTQYPQTVSPSRTTDTVSSDSISLGEYWHSILRQYLPRGLLTQYPQTVSPSGNTNTVSSDSVSLGDY